MGSFISRYKEQLWPEIRDGESARKTAFLGVAGGVLEVITALTFAASKSPFFGINRAIFLIAAGIFGAIAIGIWSLSRIAAVAGLLFFLTEPFWWLLYDHSVTDLVRTLIITIFFGLLFANGVRGTFAYRRFKVVDPSDVAPRVIRDEKRAQ